MTFSSFRHGMHEDEEQVVADARKRAARGSLPGPGQRCPIGSPGGGSRLDAASIPIP